MQVIEGKTFVIGIASYIQYDGAVHGLPAVRFQKLTAGDIAEPTALKTFP